MLTTTIFTSPQREAGISGGRAGWRGNHPPTLSREVFEWLKPKMIADPTPALHRTQCGASVCGSGTTGDVAKQLGIACWSGDLHSGFNLLAGEIPTPADLVWVHPPYWDIILYSGQVWGKEAHPADLSRCPDYETFVQRLDQAHYNAYQAVQAGGHLAVLVGDVKRKGLLYPIMRDMRWYGEPVQVVIKLQHNVQSASKAYSGNFVSIAHEYLVVTPLQGASRKPRQYANAWLVSVRLSQTREIDQRGLEQQGWRSIVWTVLSALGGRGELQAIYRQANAHARVKLAETKGTDPRKGIGAMWQAIIRRVLQESCTPVERGLWALSN